MKNFLTGRIKSFGYAFKGIATLIGSQPNAQIHLVATLLVVGLGFWLDIQRGEWIAVLLAMALVWLAEGMNTALEFLTDLASPDFHPLAGKAKDVAAGAVLIAAIFAAAVGIIVFGPYLGEKLGIS